MLEVKETSPVAEMQHGHTVVGETAVVLTASSFKFTRGILLRTPGPNDPVPNTDVVYVGRSGVQANTGGSGGMPLPPGSRY